MGLKYLVKLLRRFRVVILVTLTFVVSVRAQCDSYGLRNAPDDDGDWQLYKFTEPERCLFCFFGTSGQSEAKLVLPCWDQDLQRISSFMVSFMFCRPGRGSSEMPLSYRSDTICENTANDNQFLVEESAEFVDQCIGGNIAINVDQSGYSYHLKSPAINENAFICLTDVENTLFTGCISHCSEEYQPVCGSDGITYMNPCMFSNTVCDFPYLTLKHEGECNPGSMPIGTGISTAATPNSTIVKTKTHGGSMPIVTVISTAATPNSTIVKTKTHGDKVALPLWIWIIVPFGTIVILGCGILISRKILTHLCQHEPKEAKGTDVELPVVTNGTASIPIRENQAETYQRHIYSDGTYDQVDTLKDATSNLPKLSHTYFETKVESTNGCGRPVYYNHETKMGDRSVYSGQIYN